MPISEVVVVTWFWVMDAIASATKPIRVRAALKAALTAAAIAAAILCNMTRNKRINVHLVRLISFVAYVRQKKDSIIALLSLHSRHIRIRLDKSALWAPPL
jgi:hypothetical protein